MSRFGIGIVGTGLIANVVADAIARSSKAKLAAVSSRRLETAKEFAAKHQEAAAVQGIKDLLSRADVDAVYVATPTVAKEEIALAAIAAGKHVLVDKPFFDHASAVRMTRAAADKGVAFMDATHFVHHPRTAAIRAASPEKIGPPRSLHTSFYFPTADPKNIRLDPTQEPTGAVGDMAWYSMRAVVEYLRPAGKITRALTVVERHPQTNGVMRASGIIAFEGGEDSTFDVGYTAGTLLMTLQLLGTKGVIGMDDFVLDWADSFAFKNPDIKVGYSVRTGMATRKDATFVPTPSSAAQEVGMVDNFADLAASSDSAKRAAYAEASLKTQEYVDAIWAAVSR
jgi:predicted dehydrogenase